MLMTLRYMCIYIYIHIILITLINYITYSVMIYIYIYTYIYIYIHIYIHIYIYIYIYQNLSMHTDTPSNTAAYLYFYLCTSRSLAQTIRKRDTHTQCHTEAHIQHWIVGGGNCRWRCTPSECAVSSGCDLRIVFFFFSPGATCPLLPLVKRC